ncbi:MAG: hypothetical protein ACR2O1_10170 [Boseongicola sp.]
MPHVVNTDAMVAQGILTPQQADVIKRRSRDTMLALVVNIMLTAGIVAASLGFVFWIADAAGVAALGLLFLLIGSGVLARGSSLYRMLGSASALVGAGMLCAGGGFELWDKYPDIAGVAMLLVGLATIAGFLVLYFRGPQSLSFVTGSIALMGLILHLCGVGILLDSSGVTGWIQSLHFLYAAAAIAAVGTALDVRVVTAAAIVPFAQALETGTWYFHAAYVFYSPEPTLTILQMAALIGVAVWIISRMSDRLGRHAGILAIMAAVVGNLAFLVGSLWGDDVGMSFFRDSAPSYTDFENWQDHTAAYAVWRDQFFQISEHAFSIVWAILLFVGAWFAAVSEKRGLFNTVVTFGAIHAYTQIYETFSDEPMFYALGGLAVIPLAWGIWRLNGRMFQPQT